MARCHVVACGIVDGVANPPPSGATRHPRQPRSSSGARARRPNPDGYDYADCRRLAETALRAGLSVLLRGHPGVGKSALAHDLAAGLQLPLHEIRLAQREPAELGGVYFPDRERGALQLLAPDWVHAVCATPGFVFLDEVNADDCNIYVRTERAGLRVKESVTRFIEKCLRLKVNEQKSAVAKTEERHFVGFRLRREPLTGEVEVLLSQRSKDRIDAKIRALTPRNWGQPFDDCVHQANVYLRG